MTLRLILIRHAKSSWDNPAGDDHTRVLNDRGRASATALAGWLADNGYVPGQVFCSDAARTHGTLGLILPVWPDARVAYRHDLYHASPDRMLMVLHRATAPVVALIGHNPGAAMLASGLVAKPPVHPRFADFPTGAVAVIDFDGAEWETAQPGQGRAVDFVVPRDLIGGNAD